MQGRQELPVLPFDRRAQGGAVQLRSLVVALPALGARVTSPTSYITIIILINETAHHYRNPISQPISRDPGKKRQENHYSEVGCEMVRSV